jgi:hypothetical protein
MQAVSNSARQTHRIRNGLVTGQLMVDQQRVVCSTCRSNCGQCGITDIVGDVPDELQPVVKTLYYTAPVKRSIWRRIGGFLLIFS